MRVCIHRGAHEIGGSCIELEAEGARILLDLGRPLWARPGEKVPLPPVAGLANGDDPSLLGVLISHPHQDHYGLVGAAHPSVPIFMGEAAARILREAAFFVPGIAPMVPTGFLRHRVPFTLGPFRITPYLNDHSAFDAYSLLVEADGRRLFYTGDIRGHGRKAALFDQLLRYPPRNIDVLLLEGTHVSADGPLRTVCGPSERDVEDDCLRTLRSTPGMVLAVYSAQNIDRLVTLYRAARRAGRELVVDLYTTTVALATGSSSIPKPGFEGLRVFVPRSQRVRVLRQRAFERVAAVRSCRIFGDELVERPDRFVLTFRSSMSAELEAMGALSGARAVWSLWPGYLDQSEDLRAFLSRQGIELVVHHSSGHAWVPDLRRLAEALAPARVVPIHSVGGDRFGEFTARVERHRDGEGWPA